MQYFFTNSNAHISHSVKLPLTTQIQLVAAWGIFRKEPPASQVVSKQAVAALKNTLVGLVVSVPFAIFETET